MQHARPEDSKMAYNHLDPRGRLTHDCGVRTAFRLAGCCAGATGQIGAPGRNRHRREFAGDRGPPSTAGESQSPWESRREQFQTCAGTIAPPTRSHIVAYQQHDAWIRGTCAATFVPGRQGGGPAQRRSDWTEMPGGLPRRTCISPGAATTDWGSRKRYWKSRAGATVPARRS